MKPNAQYSIGIDLGTTNSVIAYTAINADPLAPPKLLPVPQLTAPSTVEPRDNLPSFLYLATEAEAAAGTFNLPWIKGKAGAKTARDYAVGQFAQKQSADV